MKIAFLFSPYTCPRPLDFNNIWTDSRGLSGSDLGILRMCQEFVKNGNEVYLFTSFTPNNQPNIWEGVKLHKYEQKNNIIDNTFDAVISWSCPDDLRELPENILRVCCDMLNGFSYCQNGFDNFVDLWTFCSEPHKAYNLSFGLVDEKKVEILPLGCDLEVYNQEKIPGRMIWASSAERGLFWLLSIWPEVKKVVPEAHLRIFYNFNYGTTSELEKGICENQNAQPDVYEFAQRIRYMEYAIKKLKHLGVEQIGSVSREIINKEMSQAIVMAYPCDPIAWCEGFSCSLMEACAAQSCPISTKADALDYIYGETFPTINLPVGKNLNHLTDLIIKSLTDAVYRDTINKKCEQLASQHTWKITAQKLNNMITDRLKSKKEISSMINYEKTIKLNIACGPNIFPFDGWINMDKCDFKNYFDFVGNPSISLTGMPPHQQKLATFLRNGGDFKFENQDMIKPFSYKNNSVDMCVIGQAIEHLNYVYQAPQFLAECLRILKPGGIIHMSTPDLNKLIKAFNMNDMNSFANDQPEFYKGLDRTAQLSMIMFGASGQDCTQSNYEGHFFCYSEQSMFDLLTKVGFKDIRFMEPGKSRSEIINREVIDYGFSHSLIVEAIK